MAQIVRRLIGLHFDGRPIYAPKHAHSLLLSAAGGGKTTCGGVVWLQSLLPDWSRAIVITDSKEGEIAAQCVPMCIKYGRKVAVIDEFGILRGLFGPDDPYHVSLDRFGAVARSFVLQNGELVFSIDNACHALIEEPPKDSKNRYFRDEPRTLIEYAECSLLESNPSFAVPGGVWSLLADADLLLQRAEIDIEEGSEYLQALARRVIGMSENGEHWPQHLSAALQALRIYSASSPLHRTGTNSKITFEQVTTEPYVVFIVGPVRHMERLGPDYALLLQSFLDVLLSGITGHVTFILDEFTNAPLQSLISQLTTMRGYGGVCHMIAQSRTEIQRKYGEKETATIEENAVLKQWFGFSSFEEAERVSRAMGETQTVNQSLNVSSKNTDVSGTLSLGKERLYSAEELMRLPPDEQIIHVKDIGFIHAKKIRQNEVFLMRKTLHQIRLKVASYSPSARLNSIRPQ